MTFKQTASLLLFGLLVVPLAVEARPPKGPLHATGSSFSLSGDTLTIIIPVEVDPESLPGLASVDTDGSALLEVRMGSSEGIELLPSSRMISIPRFATEHSIRVDVRIPEDGVHFLGFDLRAVRNGRVNTLYTHFQFIERSASGVRISTERARLEWLEAGRGVRGVGAVETTDGGVLVPK